MARDTQGNFSVSVLRLPRLRHPKIPDAMKLWSDKQHEFDQQYLQTFQSELSIDSGNSPTERMLNRIPPVIDEHRSRMLPANIVLPVSREAQIKNSLRGVIPNRPQVNSTTKILPELRKKSGNLNFVSESFSNYISPKHQPPLDIFPKNHQKRPLQIVLVNHKNLSRRLRLELAR